MRTRTVTLMLGLAAFGLVASACSSGSSSSKGALTINGITATDRGSKDVSGATTATVDASNNGSTYFFSPTVLTGKGGQKLTVTVKDTGDREHTFTLADGSVDKTLQPGQTATVSVTFPGSGSLEFYCRFHKSLGMVGELTAR
jgi:plastocyanin